MGDVVLLFVFGNGGWVVTGICVVQGRFELVKQQSKALKQCSSCPCFADAGIADVSNHIQLGDTMLFSSLCLQPSPMSFSASSAWVPHSSYSTSHTPGSQWRWLMLLWLGRLFSHLFPWFWFLESDSLYADTVVVHYLCTGHIWLLKGHWAGWKLPTARGEMNILHS